MKVLVTGASGFVGKYLLRQLVQLPDLAITAVANEVPQEDLIDGVSWSKLDITSSESVDELVRSVQPEVIYHLAAQSHVPTSFSDPQQTFMVNLFGTLNLLEAAKRFAPSSTVINIGSAAAYGKTFQDGHHVDERDNFQPQNPYASSKAAADLLMAQYAESTDLKIIRLRPLNHIGPGQNKNFVVSSFASQLVEIKKSGRGGILKVGDLSPERDFLDVRDVVDAYVTILLRRDQIKSGEAFNICAGRSFKIVHVLNKLIEFSGAEVEVVVDPERLRPVDMPIVNCSSDKLRAQLNWAPKYSLEQSLRDILNSFASAKF